MIINSANVIPHWAASPGAAGRWHRRQMSRHLASAQQLRELGGEGVRLAEQAEKSAEHHRKQAEQLDQMERDNASGEGQWVRVG